MSSLVLKSILDNDPLARFLFARSVLSKTQLDTFLAQAIGRRSNKTLRDRISLRDGKVVSKGAFVRTLAQARTKVREGLFTTILMEYLEMFEAGTSHALLQVSNDLRRLRDLASDRETLLEIFSTLESLATMLTS